MSKRPLFQTIYDDLLDKITSGEYAEDQKIPTEAELARIYSVSRITSKRALDLAAEKRIIYRQPGRGSFVSAQAKKLIKKSRSPESRVYGIIQHDIADSYGLELFQTLQQLCQEAGILTLTGFSNHDIDTEKELIRRFSSYGVDAFIVLPVHDETFNHEILKLIIDSFPVVLIDRYLKDVSCPNVISKNFEGAKTGMDYLLGLGHRNIGIISRRIDSATSLQERENGIIRSVMNNAVLMDPSWWLSDLDEVDINRDETFFTARDKIKRFLQKHDELTAIFCLKYSMVAALEAAAYELGRRIPEDLSVICFDSPGKLVNRIRPLTHLKQNEQLIARTAFELIEKMLRGEPVEYRHEIDVELIAGRSCRSVKT